MRKLAIGLLAAMGVAGVAFMAPANAQGFGVYIGEGYSGYPYHHWHHRYWRHHWRGAYAFEPGCRTIVRSHINRWGEHVVARERVCD